MPAPPAARLCYALDNMDRKNRLYFGDNLKILREYVADASVDLIYVDPPFNSSATYPSADGCQEKSGEESAAQITAFGGFAVAPLYERRLCLEKEPTVIDRRYSEWRPESEAVYREIVESGPRKLADLMQALLAFLDPNDMMAYLVMMAIRLVELHRVLKPTGSIYLHCDPTASHHRQSKGAEYVHSRKLALDDLSGGFLSRSYSL